MTSLGIEMNKTYLEFEDPSFIIRFFRTKYAICHFVWLPEVVIVLHLASRGLFRKFLVDRDCTSSS